MVQKVNFNNLTGDTLTVGNTTITGTGVTVGGAPLSGGSGGATQYANTASLPKQNLTFGEFALVGNTLFITNGVGWYSVALINQSPSLNISVSDISLGATGNTINFTYTASDPDGPTPTVTATTTANTAQANVTVYTSNSTVTVENLSAEGYSANITLTATDGIDQTFGTVTLNVSYLSELWDETVLSIGTSSTDGLDNSTFIDRSTNAHTVTPSGSPVQTAFHPYHTYWSSKFNGDPTQDWLSYQSSGMVLGNSNFTFETYIYYNENGEIQTIFEIGDNLTSNSGSYTNFGLRITDTGVLSAFTPSASGIGSNSVTGTTTLLSGKWYHVAFVRNGGTFTIYLDGVQEAQANWGTGSFTDRGGYAFVGIRYGNSGESASQRVKALNGYLSSLRFIVGDALYTSNFTPTEEPLTDITNTKLLLFVNRKQHDQSSNQSNIYQTSNTNLMVPWNPFEPVDEYAVGENKGSTYLSGSSTVDIPLVTALNAGTDSYSFELWVYFTSTNLNQGVIGTSSDGFAGFERSNGTWAYYQGSGATNTGVNATLNEWHHVVICRNGSSGAFFVDGQRLATFTDTGDKTNRGTFNIGYNGVAGGAYTIGYISDYRYVIGSNPYDVTQTTLTVPTSPVGNTNASLYLPFDNAGIFDKTGLNTLTLVGDTSTSTTQTKFADTAIYFDGNDRISLDASGAFGFGTGDFTFEFWLNYKGGNGYVCFFNNAPDSGNYIYYGLNTGTKNPWVWNAGNVLTTTNAVTNDVWQHHAVTRENGTLSIYLNGTQIGTTSWNVDLGSSRPLYIGSTNTAAQGTIGYIENFQILKGFAKYTTNFTVPSREQGRTYQAES